MAIIIDNDGIKFLEEFKVICDKYVKDASVITVFFKDGTSIGMRSLLQVGLGVKQIQEVIKL